jgi:ArsR family transcriptional regulator
MLNVFKEHQMNKFDKTAISAEADFFKALGHPTRLWIVRELASKEHCVCEFVEAVGDEFPTISRHLSILKEAGVVVDERRGKSIYYRLACPCVLDMLKCMKKRLQS